MHRKEAVPTMELKLISCNDLKAFNFFQKLTLYAVVWIESDDPNRTLKESQSQQQRTRTDREADGDGANPEWHHDAIFDLAWITPSLLEGSEGLFFRFEFRHDGTLLGDKLIGECRVPVADLVRDAAKSDAARSVSYQVRSGEGKPNGIFNFSYRLKGTGDRYESSQILEGRISGYPVLDPQDFNPNHSLVQYPPMTTTTTAIGSACCYPTVGSGGAYSPSAAVGSPVSPFGKFDNCHPPFFPPQVPSYGGCACNYPPPPPPPYPYPYPYPPTVAHGGSYYPPVEHVVHHPHPWASSGLSFENRW
ncbi:hypothetical protein HN51_041269 [Arachis hypogaea]|uniref:uncharacterized protein n=2 Tax=Arachis TaxID=3817 RepID=UPI000DEC43E2|nr:protein SRC2 [Arachis hypogaea]QHN86993.1 uncharacterized protein DS421_16g551120 [Arachis hypogaea]